MIKKLEVGLLARVLVNQGLLILKDKEIAKLQKQVQLAQAATDRMESCYIEMKKEAEQLQSELKCCRQENAVLLGKVGELQERVNTTKSSQSKLHKTEMGDCLHFNTTMFHEGKATCFECDAVVNHKRKVIGVMQTRTLRGES